MICDFLSYLSHREGEWWVAFWTAALFFATSALALIAWVEIRAAKDENRETQTLLACGRYDTDPTIFYCHQELVKAKLYKARDDEAILAKAISLRLEIITILNFLDAIAIGTRQGLYLKHLVKEHLHAIVRRHVAELIESGVLEVLECPRENFAALISLDREWHPT